MQLRTHNLTQYRMPPSILMRGTALSAQYQNRTVTNAASISNRDTATLRFGGLFKSGNAQAAELNHQLRCLQDGQTVWMSPEGAIKPGGKADNHQNIVFRRLGETLIMRCPKDGPEVLLDGQPVPTEQWVWMEPKKPLSLPGGIVLKSPYPKSVMFSLCLTDIEGEALAQSLKYQRMGFLGFEDRIADGFRTSTAVGLDGIWSRKARPLIPLMSSEILVVDRKSDPVLADWCDWARSLKTLPEADRIQTIVHHIWQLLGKRDVPDIEKQIAAFPKKRMYLGEAMTRQAGVCRHMALLFKVLADEAGISAGIRRGLAIFSSGMQGMNAAHIWNEVMLHSPEYAAEPYIHDLSLGQYWVPFSDSRANIYRDQGAAKPVYAQYQTTPLND